MNAPILNREFKHPSDGWYHIEPKGEHPNGPLIQVIDDEAAAGVANRFNADAGAGKLSHGHEMLIDHEHFKHDSEKETRAYGWLQALQNRADGIYGKIRWSTTGQAAVDGGDYRFFSTEYDPADLKVLNDTKKRKSPGIDPAQRVRPLRLDGLTLTNSPNNKGQRPITNRSMTDGHDNLADANALAANQAGGACAHKQDERKIMKNIATKLGLSAEASEDSILAEVAKLQNRLTTLEPLETDNLKLKNRIKQLDDDSVAALLAERKITGEKVINRLKPVIAGYATREERIAALDDFGFKGGEGASRTGTTTGHKVENQTQQTKLFNRGTKPPETGKATDETNDKADKVAATKIMNRAAELKKATPNLSDATAVIMAQTELENAS